MILDDDNHLAHYGVLRKSGRYPWGSGANPAQRSKSFMDHQKKLRDEGLSEVEIARGFGMSVKELRETNTIARNAKKSHDISYATRLKDKGYSNVAIGEKMEINESSVRSLLKDGEQEKLDILTNTAQMLRDQVAEKGYIDIGKGVANQLQISPEKLSSAVSILKDEGYFRTKVQVPQAGTKNMTTVTVLAKPGENYRSVKANIDKIQQIQAFSDNGGRTFYGLLPPMPLSSKRIQVIHEEDGGALADGVMYVRPGVKDLDLGGSRYAQVRVLVDGTHYLKGMAMYKEDMPKGVDVQFNTNKSKKDPKILEEGKLGAFKKITDDPDNPFGAAVDQIGEMGPDGRPTKLTSVMNLVNKEGDWDGWRKSIASQVLSKQSPRLAKDQLEIQYSRKRKDLDEILALTNPAVKKKLLDAYADSADSASVHMKAAELPRQRAQVILPLKTIKEGEVFAPNFNDGERVALIRYPHGGTFEIPEVTVNNRVPEGKSLIGIHAQDAIGIHPETAKRLSGADFDGDTVLVIPNNQGKLKTTPALEGLKNFDPQRTYKLPDDAPQMKPKTKQMQMGLVSNLITDMTIQGASTTELAAAVRHSMVVIDAEKHHLDYKQSAKDNNISALMKKYQPRPDGRYGGSSTLISKAKSPVTIRARAPRSAAKGGAIDPATGKKMYEDKPGWVDPKTGEMRYGTVRSKKLVEADDAHTLSSGTKIEQVYADHSNRMKALANEARKANYHTKVERMSPDAKKAYAKEVESLNSKLNIALQNSPLERQAQLIANARVQMKRDANPNMDSAQIKKAQAQALAQARDRTGAKKELVTITPNEWDAIQANAISPNKLTQILNNTNIETVKTLATPRPKLLMSGGNLAKARAMAAAGRTQAEIASALGVSLTTVKEGLKSG